MVNFFGQYCRRTVTKLLGNNAAPRDALEVHTATAKVLTDALWRDRSAVLWHAQCPQMLNFCPKQSNNAPLLLLSPRPSPAVNLDGRTREFIFILTRQKNDSLHVSHRTLLVLLVTLLDGCRHHASPGLVEQAGAAIKAARSLHSR